MGTVMDPNIIKTTQTTLGKYVKRPPLSDKLLRKPPFRFLHDIVTSILKSTGFFNGLFDENELVSENVKDREAKIAFLNKIIFVVEQTTGEQLFVKPSKIVAGQEPEKTNELLQCLALALDKKLTSDEAVKKFKVQKVATTGDKIIKGPVASKIEKTNTSRTKSNDRTSNNDKNQNQIPKTKLKETVKVKKESPPKNVSQQNKEKLKERSEKTINESKKSVIKDLNQDYNQNDTHITNSSNIHLEENVQSNIVIQQKNEDLINDSLNEPNNSNSLIAVPNLGVTQEHSPTSIEINDTIIDDEKTFVNNDDSEGLERNEVSNIEKINENAKTEGNSVHKDTIEENSHKATFILNRNDSKNVDNNVRPSSARPTSSRPSAPRIRDRHENNILNNNINIIGKVNIIPEKSLSEEDEESSIIIQHNAEKNEKTSQSPEHVLAHQHGHLVQQILDSQKEFTHVTGKTEIEWQFEAQKARDEINKDIEQLRFNIQALSRIANPLGKLLDHMQEDVEVMRQESLQWIQTYEKTFKELSKQKALNEELLFPLSSKIKQLETEIIEKHEKINDLKIIIYKNNTKIERLLANGNVQ